MITLVAGIRIWELHPQIMLFRPVRRAGGHPEIPLSYILLGRELGWWYEMYDDFYESYENYYDYYENNDNYEIIYILYKDLHTKLYRLYSV